MNSPCHHHHLYKCYQCSQFLPKALLTLTLPTLHSPPHLTEHWEVTWTLRGEPDPPVPSWRGKKPRSFPKHSPPRQWENRFWESTLSPQSFSCHHPVPSADSRAVFRTPPNSWFTQLFPSFVSDFLLQSCCSCEERGMSVHQSRAWTAPLGNHGSAMGWGQREMPAPPEEDAPGTKALEAQRGPGWFLLLIIPTDT